ncbi:hypothetical protein ADK43_29905 [Streptomyces rimosus subsp. rimosus]|nr:hypothetical protein ADK43_29905 [Streptomyces rimosus subsp. rimosus]
MHVLDPAPGTVTPLAFHDVVRAAPVLRDVVARTPLLRSPEADDLLGRPVYVKAENTQRTGAYKFRGAYLALSRIPPLDRARGIVTDSGGNHAHAVALAGRLLGAPVTAILPDDSDDLTRSAITALGATVVLHHPDEIAEPLVRRLLAQGHTLLRHNGHRNLISGAGTVALEMMQDAADLEALLVPLGSGTLAAGAALVTQHHPGVRVFGFEPSAAAGTQRSLSVGRRLSGTASATSACCLRRDPARLPFAIIQQHLYHQVLTVTEADIARAMSVLWRYFGQVAEPSGAVALAGLLAHSQQLPDGPVGVVLSGGNIDPRHFRQGLEATSPCADTA